MRRIGRGATGFTREVISRWPAIPLPAALCPAVRRRVADHPFVADRDDAAGRCREASRIRPDAAEARIALAAADEILRGTEGSIDAGQ